MTDGLDSPVTHLHTFKSVIKSQHVYVCFVCAHRMCGPWRNVEIMYYITQLMLFNLYIVSRTNEVVVLWILKGHFTNNEEKLW
jgi:hypothetical protein